MSRAPWRWVAQRPREEPLVCFDGSSSVDRIFAARGRGVLLHHALDLLIRSVEREGDSSSS
jgi:hypothetical protein